MQLGTRFIGTFKTSDCLNILGFNEQTRGKIGGKKMFFISLSGSLWTTKSGTTVSTSKGT